MPHLPSTRSALIRDPIVLLCLSQAVSVWGEHVLFFTGLPLWAYDHLGGTGGVTLALMAVNIPALLSWPAGALIGGLPPRPVLQTCVVIRLALVALIVLLATKAAPPLFLLLLSAATLLVDSFFMPALKGALPEWCGGSGAGLARANGLLEAADAPGFLLGPPAGALLYGRWGLIGPVAAQALAYGLALPLFRAAAPPDPAGEAEQEQPLPSVTLPNSSSWTRVSGWGRVTLGAAWTASALVLGLTEALALPFVREVLHDTEVSYGILGGLVGVGVTAGAFFWSMPAILRRCSVLQRFLLAQAVAGAALIAFAAGRSLPVCGTAWTLGGVGFVGLHIAMTTWLQGEPDAQRRTRSLGLAHTLEAAGVLAGASVAPLLAARFGIPQTLADAGFCLLLCAAMAFLFVAFGASKKQ